MRAIWGLTAILRIYGFRHRSLHGRAIAFAAVLGAQLLYLLILGSGVSVWNVAFALPCTVVLDFVWARFVYAHELEKRKPGVRLTVVAQWLWSEHEYEETIAPMIACWEKEWQHSVEKGQHVRAVWVRLRGYWTFAENTGIVATIGKIVGAVAALYGWVRFALPYIQHR
jgi:hypothetical protein